MLSSPHAWELENQKSANCIRSNNRTGRSDYYHDRWNVEQAFRMSKSDMQARPIFHRTEDAIRAHMLFCFMALMMGKYLEIKMHRSLRKIQEEIWRVHEIHLCY